MTGETYAIPEEAVCVQVKYTHKKVAVANRLRAL